MNIALLSLVSIGLYAAGTIYQIGLYLKKLPSRPFLAFFIGLVAVACQTIITHDHLFTEAGRAFDFFSSASLITSIAVIALLLASLKKPLQALFIIAYPVAGISLIGVALSENHLASIESGNEGIFIHVILSIASYSVFTLATIQAVLLYIQNNNLKKRRQTLLIRNLPPLLMMESLLFEMLWIGMGLLTVAILAGFVFVEDIFAQQLAHKSVFSIAAWCVFAALLFGRKQYGWRGITASKWTLWGSSLLILGFFGSKFVIEFIIG